jgi:hypothetical protein
VSTKNFLVQGPCHDLHSAIVDLSKTFVLLSKESVLSCCKTRCVTLGPALFWVIYCALYVCVWACVLGYPKSLALHLVMYMYCHLMEVLQHHRFWLDEDRTAAGVQWFYQQCRKFLAEFCCLVLQWNACHSSCGDISAPLSGTIPEWVLFEQIVLFGFNVFWSAWYLRTAINSTNMPGM